MDDPGWHARRRAEKEQDYHHHLYHTPQGQYYPVAHVDPMPEYSIGGAYAAPLSPRPPVPPPKHPPQLPPRPQPAVDAGQLAHMTPVERSHVFKVAHMDPPLQFMCGPLLKYDTVVNNVWYGAALIVTADSGSIYEPFPSLTYEWDPDQPPSYLIQPQWTASDGSTQSASTYELGPHPADPHSTVAPALSAQASVTSWAWQGVNNGGLDGKPRGINARSRIVKGQEIYAYAGQSGSFTFWRFHLEIPLSDNELEVTYYINFGQRMRFFIPGKQQSMRCAAHSCNGFSAGVNPDDFRGPGFKSGYDPLWIDLLTKHAEKPFHVMIGGGDQIYCDRLINEPEMQDWVKLKPDERKTYPLTDQISKAIDRFLFHHYCQHFRSGAFARANCSIPMLNMCDLIDGFGSYPDDMQRAPVFQRIGSRGYFFFLLFQCLINVEIDGVDDRPGQHFYKSLIIGGLGPYVRLNSHSFLSYLGPYCQILLLDCRAERRKDQVCSQQQYQKVFERLRRMPERVEHLIVQLGIPIAYPRMVFLEAALESKFNPLIALGKSGSLGLSGFVNRFNADAELLDDLNDHWTARSHKRERNWLVEQLQQIARMQRLRVSFLSGDVHCAAVGVFKTLRHKHKADVEIVNDFRYMVNVVTSAIVNTPPPVGVLTMVSSLATKTHKTMHHANTDETMVPLFTNGTSGSTRKQKYIMGKRNWCQIEWDPCNGELVFDLRVEKEKGLGDTVSYPVRVVPPGWSRGQ
ncbi:hypothetical protein AMATHDRAFT_74220 [Amanita thiersii Skay4041]|uniref:PhoD-like phosphatase domain-containing protein n=1 Tax=Amanita thiersii Skay4041 TaxID=703135 RepID=A0A2A9NQP8_9AGAR|nr:hypothetical protein AMATHDRAFT_74220 [Amanita thiersii Skay4041]